jgi:hypothetical protein
VSNTDDKQSDVRIRRAPKFSTFLILGGGVGAIVSFVLTALFPVDPSVGFGALFGYFALYGVTGGVLIGAVIAIILDRQSLKHVSTASVVVERTERPEQTFADDNLTADRDAAPASDVVPAEGSSRANGATSAGDVSSDSDTPGSGHIAS